MYTTEHAEKSDIPSEKKILFVIFFIQGQKIYKKKITFVPIRANI